MSIFLKKDFFIYYKYHTIPDYDNKKVVLAIMKARMIHKYNRLFRDQLEQCFNPVLVQKVKMYGFQY